jgi:hypothetical protein
MTPVASRIDPGSGVGSASQESELVKRRDLLRATAALPSLAATVSALEADTRKKHKNKNKNNKNKKDKTRRNVAGMNVVLFITDQQRAIMHFPKKLVMIFRPVKRPAPTYRHRTTSPVFEGNGTSWRSTTT